MSALQVFSPLIETPNLPNQPTMVSLQQIQASNARINTLAPGLVAVFVGGTSGIGEATMKEFAKHAFQPRIYFIGRSEEAAARITIELESLNPGGQYHFIKADISLLRNVDNVCLDIQSRESLINLLFLTSGTAVTGIGKISDCLSRYYLLTRLHRHC